MLSLKPSRTLTLFYFLLLSLLEENKRPLKISIQVKIKIIKIKTHKKFTYIFGICLDKQTTTRGHKKNECITINSKIPNGPEKAKENAEREPRIITFYLGLKGAKNLNTNPYSQMEIENPVLKFKCKNCQNV